jgi:hypothetical protein
MENFIKTLAAARVDLENFIKINLDYLLLITTDFI